MQTNRVEFYFCPFFCFSAILGTHLMNGGRKMITDNNEGEKGFILYIGDYQVRKVWYEENMETVEFFNEKLRKNNKFYDGDGVSEWFYSEWDKDQDGKPKPCNVMMWQYQVESISDGIDGGTIHFLSMKDAFKYIYGKIRYEQSKYYKNKKLLRDTKHNERNVVCMYEDIKKGEREYA